MSTTRVTLLCLVLAAGALGAQSLPEPTGPGDLVLPPIILEVEDLSEVHVEARLPPEEDLVPPDRRFPLPEPGALAIVEPSLPSAAPAGGGSPGGGVVSPLATRATLGAGTLRGISAGVRLSAEGTPDLEASFAHESLDGFGGHPPGAGFDLRDDRLSAAVGLGPWGADLDIHGSWIDSARGLQGLGGGYASLTTRSLAGGVSLSGKPVSWLTLAGGLEVEDDEIVLTGASPYRRAEMGVSPSFAGTAAFGRWSIGLSVRYAFHTGDLIPDPFADGHRFRTDLAAGVELASGWQLEGSVGWHFTSGAGGISAVPFHIGLSGAPLPFLTFSLRGGYRAVAVDLADVLAAHAFLLPQSTVDSEGWFGTLDLTIGAGKALSATAGVSYAAESWMLDASSTADGGTGLYPVNQRPVNNRLSLTAGLRWSLATWLTLNGSYAIDPYGPRYEPAGALNVELTALEASGRMGATLSAVSDTLTYFPLPRLDLGGFLRVSPAVRLRLDASDLLGPIAGPRTELGAYQRPGLRVTGTVQVEF